MKRKLLLAVVLMLVSIAITKNLQAQGTNKKDSTNTKVPMINGLAGPQNITDEIKFKNEFGSAIITITDEGNNIGSITLPGATVAPTATTNKLYNVNGTLNFNGTEINSGGGGTKYAIGDFAQGGIVFWLDETNQHGLVCAKEDYNSGSLISWFAGGVYTIPMARGDGTFSGEMNTTIIIADQGKGDGSTYAALACSELQVIESGKVYGDWYLPSKHELNLLYLNKEIINTTALANGGGSFVESYYWSSTVDIGDFVWIQEFVHGSQSINQTFPELYLRAIRAF